MIYHIIFRIFEIKTMLYYQKAHPTFSKLKRRSTVSKYGQSERIHKKLVSARKRLPDQRYKNPNLPAPCVVVAENAEMQSSGTPPLPARPSSTDFHQSINAMLSCLCHLVAELAWLLRRRRRGGAFPSGQFRRRSVCEIRTTLPEHRHDPVALLPALAASLLYVITVF